MAEARLTVSRVRQGRSCVRTCVHTYLSVDVVILREVVALARDHMYVDVLQGGERIVH